MLPGISAFLMYAIPVSQLFLFLCFFNLQFQIFVEHKLWYTCVITMIQAVAVLVLLVTCDKLCFILI